VVVTDSSILVFVFHVVKTKVKTIIERKLIYEKCSFIRQVATDKHNENKDEIRI
jgi:hypothetical protein